MRDYWLTQYILSAIGWGYLILVFVALGLALWLAKGKTAKTVAMLVVLGLASVLPFQAYQESAKEKEGTDAYRIRLVKAQALFYERCKAAGEKIYRTVGGVEGVFLLTVRKEASKSEQYELNDQAGDGAHELGYIETFFMGKQNDFLLTDQNKQGAYRFVEMADDATRTITRYTDGRQSPGTVSLNKIPLTKETVTGSNAKYGVLTEDISTLEDRQNWVAGSRIKVISLESKEIVAERVGYMFDQALGNTSGGRSPWAFAAYSACPAFPKLHGQYPHQWGLTRNFVEKILKPIQGE